MCVCVCDAVAVGNLVERMCVWACAYNISGCEFREVESVCAWACMCACLSICMFVRIKHSLHQFSNDLKAQKNKA